MSLLVTTFHGHTHQVFCVAWSPDGKYIASGSRDTTAQVWEARTGRHLAAFRGHDLQVMLIAWAPHGKLIASCSFDDEKIRTWEAMTGEPDTVYADPRCDDQCLAWSPDGQFLASSGYDATVQIRESSSGKLITLYRGHPPGPRREGRDPFSKRVLSYHAVVVWSIAWSPDGRYLASASGNTFRLGMEDPPAEYDTVQVWEAVTGRHVYTYMGHTHEVRGLAWSPDGDCIASASLDRTVQVWYAPV